MPEQIFEILPQLKDPVTIFTALGIALLAVVTFINRIVKGIQPSMSGFQNIIDHKDNVLKKRIADNDLDPDLREILKQKLSYTIFQKETKIIGQWYYRPVIELLKTNPRVTIQLCSSSQDYFDIKDGIFKIRFTKWDKFVQAIRYIGVVGFEFVATVYLLQAMFLGKLTEASYYINLFIFILMSFAGLNLFGIGLVKYRRAQYLKSILEESEITA